jgi:hypothetical protein
MIRSENAQLRRQRIVSLHVFCDNAQLCYALLAKMGSDRKYLMSGKIKKKDSQK